MNPRTNSAETNPRAFCDAIEIIFNYVEKNSHLSLPFSRSMTFVARVEEGTYEKIEFTLDDRCWFQITSNERVTTPDPIHNIECQIEEFTPHSVRLTLTNNNETDRRLILDVQAVVSADPPSAESGIGLTRTTARLSKVRVIDPQIVLQPKG